MNFKKFLENKGINLLELSKNVNIPYATLYNGIEKISSLRAENLKKIADYFNLSMDEIFEMLNKEEIKTLGTVLLEQKRAKLKGNIYHHTQVNFTYNTNRIEGSKLSEDETRYIFETNTLIAEKPSTKVDDVIETANHFYLFDIMLEEYERPLSEELIKNYHRILKNGTSDSRLDWFKVGDYKALPNEVGGKETIAPKKVSSEIKKLFSWYSAKEEVKFDDILEFHYRFESIHPFQDGNGRVGRVLMFKECLKHNIIPFIIEDEYKGLYYRGLYEYLNEKGYLRDTCLAMQDKYELLIKRFLGDLLDGNR